MLLNIYNFCYTVLYRLSIIVLILILLNGIVNNLKKI